MFHVDQSPITFASGTHLQAALRLCSERGTRALLVGITVRQKPSLGVFHLGSLRPLPLKKLAKADPDEKDRSSHFRRPINNGTICMPKCYGREPEMARINSRQVEAFRAMMLTGSVTDAAKLMAVTQPAVSRLLRDFQALLKMELFERRGSGLVPTASATALYMEVERSFVGLERITAAAEEIRSRRTGMLRIAAMPALSNGHLALGWIDQPTSDRPDFPARRCAPRAESRDYAVGNHVWDGVVWAWGCNLRSFHRAGICNARRCRASLRAADRFRICRCFPS